MSRSRKLLATCSSGLCNRLLMLAGCLRIAERTKRELLLHWPENRQLDCPFGALFSNPFRLATDADLVSVWATDRTVKLYNARHGGGFVFSEVSPDGDPEADIVAIKAWYAPKFSDDNHGPELHQELRARLLSLEARPEILQRVNGFAVPGRAIGVHIRRGEDCAEFARSKDEHFCDIMHGVLDVMPDALFFLATADPATEARMRAAFGDRLLTFQKTAPGRHRQAIEEALVDLLLLGRTAVILGNHYSSFTNTAAHLGPDLLVVAEEASAGVNLAATTAALVNAVQARKCAGASPP